MHDKRLPKVLDEQLQEELLSHYRETRDPTIRETLILHNLKLIKVIIRKYTLKDNPLRGEEDLFNEGVLGLMNAIESYDPEKGSFSNHAAIHIKATVRAYIRDKTQSIRISAGAYQTLYKIESFRREYIRQNVREPTIREVSEALSLPYKKVEELLEANRSVSSLDSPISEDEASTLIDVIEDPESDFTERVCDSVLAQEILTAAKETLNEKEHDVLRMTYGLNYSLKTISSILDVNYSYTAELRAKAIRKLKRSKYIAGLERELDEGTVWYRSQRFDSEGIRGTAQHSPVERIVMEREQRRKKLERR